MVTAGLKSDVRYFNSECHDNVKSSQFIHTTESCSPYSPIVPNLSSATQQLSSNKNPSSLFTTLRPPSPSSPLAFPFFLFIPPINNLFPPMDSQSDLQQLENSFVKQLRIPGAKVSSAEVPDTTWCSILDQNRNCAALKVLGKPLLSIRKTIELFVTVLWPRATDLQVAGAGEHMDGSRLYIARFASEEDLQSVMNRSPWTVGGQLVIMEILDPLKPVAEHKFESAKVWLQIHGLPPCVAKNSDIVLALAATAGTPDEDSLMVLQSFAKIKVSINLDMQLVSGSFLKRPHQKPIPVCFKFEKAGIICYRCARLGHKEISCQDQAFDTSQRAAFAHLEGIHSSETHTFAGKGHAGLAGGSLSVRSPLIPKNLFPDLEASLLGSGRLISELDTTKCVEQSASASVKPVSTVLKDKSLCSVSFLPAVGIFKNDTPTKQVFTSNLVCINSEQTPNTFMFKASKATSLCVTPLPTKKHRIVKGPGPAWQRVPVGCLPARNSQILPVSSPIGSPRSSSTSFDPSETSEMDSSRSKLLGWTGSFSGFNEEAAGSQSTSEFAEQFEASPVLEIGTLEKKRSWSYQADTEAQTSQSLLVWKRPKLGPSDSA